VLLLIVGAYLWQRRKAPEPAPAPRRVAVVRLANPGDAEDAYLADGMTEELVSLLSTAGIEVVARTSAARYRRGQRDVAAVGRELGADTLLEGSVRRSGDTLDVSVQLSDVDRPAPRWSRDYQRAFPEIAGLQRDITRDVVAALGVRLGDEARRRLEAGGSPSLDAYTLYLKGRYQWNKRTRAGFTAAIELFEQAIQRDAGDPRPHAGLADTYVFLGLFGYRPGDEALPKAAAAATRALALDDSRADAHTALGVARMRHDWDWAGAERELRRAVALDPGYAPAHDHLGYYLVAMGRFADGIAEIKRGLELEPLSLPASALLGWAYHYARQPERAIEQFRKTLDVEPRLSLARWGLGVAYAVSGQYDSALAALQPVVESRPDVTGDLGYAYARAGRRDDARRALNGLTARARREYVSPLAFAAIHIGLGEAGRALDWIEKAYAERNSDLIYARIDPYFDALRSEPRFLALLKKMGLDR
jgi:serine/threonine-protein kinase